MAEEIQCVMCLQFPYEPLECKNCNKLFCKYCQIQLQQSDDLSKLEPHNEDEYANPEQFKLSKDVLAKMSPRERKTYAAQMQARQQSQFIRPRKSGVTPGYDVCCPHCQARGDFLQPVNKVL
tara:strand:+ start:594 stop:959 length:366 start_codon:yes stop_codon:yes gene_type:complete